MTTKNSLLDQLSIPSPCSVDWNELVGEGRERFCEQCDKHVYDFSKMTATEAVALLSTLRGRVCARITRQSDGTVLTEEPLPLLPAVRRRASPFASVAVTTLITITASPVGPLSAQAATIVQTNLDKGTRVPDRKPQPGDTTASIGGTVLDQSEAVIAGAKVSLTNQASGETRVVTSSDVGVFSFSGLGEGTFTVLVGSPGFATSQIEDIKVASRQQQRVDVRLQVGPAALGGDIASIPKPLRALYKESELIVVARIGESKTVRRERDARRVRTTLRVLSILKGKSKVPTVDLYHWSFGDLTGPFVAGEEMLLFLKRTTAESGQGSPAGYEVGDTQYGIKKVVGDELTAYQNRIAELSQIYHGDGPFDVAIVEWLVRCAEDPATRWEGAYELVWRIDRPFDYDADEDRKADLTSTSSENAKPLEEPELQVAAPTRDVLTLITAEQKARLMTALVQIVELRDRDLPLITLALRWKEPRLVAFLIGQLHSFEARPPRLAQGLMDVLGAELNDEAIATLARDYATQVSYLDEESEENPSEASSQSAKAARVEEAAAAIQTRSEMLAKFLQAVGVALAERQLK